MSAQDPKRSAIALLSAARFAPSDCVRKEACKRAECYCLRRLPDGHFCYSLTRKRTKPRGTIVC